MFKRVTHTEYYKLENKVECDSGLCYILRMKQWNERRGPRAERRECHYLILGALICVPLLVLAACDLGPGPGVQRGLPTATVLGRIIRGDDEATPEPGSTRPSSSFRATSIPTIT